MTSTQILPTAAEITAKVIANTEGDPAELRRLIGSLEGGHGKDVYGSQWKILTGSDEVPSFPFEQTVVRALIWHQMYG